MTEQELVKHCLHDICKKNGLGGPSTIVQRDVELISQEIETGTGILISVSTIKRLLNGEFSRMPQTATLNAISSYLGFKNWQHYKNSIVTAASAGENKKQNSSLNKNSNFRFSLNWKWAGAGVIAAGLIIFFSFVKLSRQLPHYEKAVFHAKKTTANSIPNTVVFNYNIDEVNADSFFIQQSWDRRRRVKIEKHNYTLTDIYYEPGYHIAKLIANDSVIRTIDISIPTDNWFFCVKDLNPRSIPRYIKSSTAFKKGFLGLDKTDLNNNQIETTERKNFLYTYFPAKLEVSSDNFRLKTRVRMVAVRNNECPYIMYEVFCQRYFMYFKSMPKGCASETDAQFGENALKGKTADLSELCYDVSGWEDIEMTVKNKVVTIFFNNQQVYTAAYNNSSGMITGLGFISNGLCEVDFVELKGLDGKVVYENDF